MTLIIDAHEHLGVGAVVEGEAPNQKATRRVARPVVQPARRAIGDELRSQADFPLGRDPVQPLRAGDDELAVSSTCDRPHRLGKLEEPVLGDALLVERPGVHRTGVDIDPEHAIAVAVPNRPLAEAEARFAGGMGAKALHEITAKRPPRAAIQGSRIYGRTASVVGGHSTGVKRG